MGLHLINVTNYVNDNVTEQLSPTHSSVWTTALGFVSIQSDKHDHLSSFDNIAYNIAGNNADNKVDTSDSSASYNVARSCGLDPHTGIRLNPERASI